MSVEWGHQHNPMEATTMEPEELFAHAIALTPALIAARNPEIRQTPTQKEICHYIRLAARGVELAWRETLLESSRSRTAFPQTQIPDAGESWFPDNAGDTEPGG